MNLGPHAVVCRFCFHGGAKYPTLSLTSEYISINDIFDEERRIEPGALVSFTMTGYTMNELLFHCCSKLELYIQHLGEPQHLHYILVQDLVNKHVAGHEALREIRMHPQLKLLGNTPPDVDKISFIDSEMLRFRSNETCSALLYPDQGTHSIFWEFVPPNIAYSELEEFEQADLLDLVSRLPNVSVIFTCFYLPSIY